MALFLLGTTTTCQSFVIPLPSKIAPQHPHIVSSSSSTALRVAIDTSEIKNGMTVELDNEPYKVLSFSIMKQARGAAKTTIKFKNLIRGTTIENTYRSGEKFETAMIERKAAQYTYKDEVSY
jgi:Elongation factor P (EF-P) KOW-like domain